jgi:hypothetical protein
MASLSEQLGGADKRPQVIDDSCRVLDQEVADKSGISGLAIKASYKVVQGVAPGFIRQVVDHLLDDFTKALDPLYQEALDRGESPGAYLEKNRSKVADALLAITDSRARNAQRAIIKSTYDKLRPTAQRHVEAAAPRLGQLLDKHAAKTR